MRYSAEEQSRMINLTGLKERGWTNSMVNKLLSAPLLFQNPQYRRAAPMKKWWIEEVEAVEQTEEFQRLFKKAQVRKTAGSIAASKRKQATLDQITEITNNLQVHIWPENLLEQETLAAKEEIEMQKGHYSDVYNIQDNVLNRWKVNFVRHNLTNYEDVLNSLYGVVGKQEAYKILKYAVLDKIGESYPYLKEECQRQKSAEQLRARF